MQQKLITALHRQLSSSPDHDVQNDANTHESTTEDFKELLEKLKSLELENASLKAKTEVLICQKGLLNFRVFQCEIHF